ncbi:OPT oligopeptide transporter protein-domain-containing protein [Dimargaris cristalligena]|uniref:OPT oligopeptide transporter protein-domain-containing protein n=1 Tax=Dimargaris cristalligena TaxID=215637 RepID=A0A4P9ZX99_9FUNG|nr:OPT oligopeptide transporter protein-domain-containing protein [Dimargaris cristalligena]|eukprot:RKP37988.1 OPT oligopeptide transporter protein-domain-containing protein [Dimargaris cristalligena]
MVLRSRTADYQLIPDAQDHLPDTPAVAADPYSRYTSERAFLPIDNTGPHFTWRSVIVGLLIGCLLCFSNMYFGLQTGWISMMSLQSSLVGFVLFKLAAFCLPINFGPAENVILQTTAVATATMPLAGGFVGIVPALKMLTLEDNPGGGSVVMNFGELVLWGMGLAFFGVFFAIPLRRQTIIKEKLKFPSGTATAQMISVLHQRKDPTLEAEELDERVRPLSKSNTPSRNSSMEHISSQNAVDLDDDTAKRIAAMDADWKSKGYALMISFAISGGYTVAAHMKPFINNLPVFGATAAHWNWTYRPSPSYMGQGVIMGLPTCLAMTLGAIVGWGFLSPLSHYQGWAPGPVKDWKTGPQGWILWISLAVMIAESLVSLGVMTFKEGRQLWVKYQGRRAPRNPTFSEIMDLDNLDVHPRHLVPNWVVYGGLFLSSVLCVVAMTILFRIPIYATILAVFIACLLSILGVRALGETDLNPVSGIGKVSQVIFAGVVPGNLVANLVAGGIAEAGAQQAGDMMQDLKTGHLLHASPRAQFYGQMLGSFFSVFVSVGAYMLYTSTYEIPGPEFEVPTAQVWLDMSRLVNGHSLPTNSGPFIIGFSLLFACLPILETMFSHQRWVKYLPSGIAFAIGEGTLSLLMLALGFNGSGGGGH